MYVFSLNIYIYIYMYIPRDIAPPPPLVTLKYQKESWFECFLQVWFVKGYILTSRRVELNGCEKQRGLRMNIWTSVCCSGTHSALANTVTSLFQTLRLLVSIWDEIVGKQRPSGFMDFATLSLTVSCSPWELPQRADILRSRGMYFHYVVWTDAFNLAPCGEPWLGNVRRCYFCVHAVVTKHLTPGPVLKTQHTWHRFNKHVLNGVSRQPHGAHVLAW